MRAEHQRCRMPWAVAIALLLGGPLSASDLQRPYDPVVVDGRSLPLLVGSQVEQIRVYAYRANTGQWEPIPFQIDERDNQNTYFNGTYNGVLDSLDQVVFMASDLGDVAPEDGWVADNAARFNVRYLVTVADTLGGLRQGYAYLYLSPELAASPLQYMSYNPATDLVTGVSYAIQNGVKGFADFLAINAAAGGDGLDFLDRQKFRLQVSVYGLNIEPFHEDHPWLSLRRVDYRGGAVRLMRSQVLLFSGSVFGVTFSDSLKLVTTYYPHFAYMSTGERSLVAIPNVSIRMLRFSYDLNSRAFGMVFYNPWNLAGNRINAIEAAGFNATLLWPGLNWYLITADPSYPGSALQRASVVGIVGLGGNPISDRYRLFYRDNSSPESPNTGEDGSYGETGIILEDDQTMQGTLNLTYWSYYLPENLTYQQAEQIAAQAAAPLVAWGVPEYFDFTPPARVADLGVVDAQDTFVILSLTAPGDDQWMGGAATSYEIRYHTEPVGADTAAWWEAATPVAGVPDPVEPGLAQTVAVVGLQQNTTYYFLLVAFDNVGNASPYSNVASATTLPVELSRFVARAGEGQVVLEWTTQTESNNYGFEVQRQDGRSLEWKVVGFVPGSGTTSRPHTYCFVDRRLSARTYYYRLKQVDNDGTFTFSPVVEVVVAPPASSALVGNYPNPFNPGTEISYRVGKGPQDGPVQVRLVLYNMLGQEIATLVDGLMEPGWYTVTWDGRDAFGRSAGSGLYICRFQAGQFAASMKMLKMQ
ncbi:MAG: hypothetical protein ONB14_10365 [candidate division KSB1 bacterium]|nr:hypothetical protein [candidate division KSB1 bacterium]